MNALNSLQYKFIQS